MPSELHRYQEKLKHDLTLEGSKNLSLKPQVARPDACDFTPGLRIKKIARGAEGFYTGDILENGKRVGYRTKTLQGKSRILVKRGFRQSSVWTGLE